MKHGPPFFEDYYAALKMCKINDTILSGMDRNSSMGTNDGNLCGPFGIPHTNDAGRIMHSFLSIRGLTTATTFFQKKSHGTWIHPRSKSLHQLDHIITNREKLCTVIDAGVTESMVDSDHRALKCKFRLQLNSQIVHPLFHSATSTSPNSNHKKPRQNSVKKSRHPSNNNPPSRTLPPPLTLN